MRPASSWHGDVPQPPALPTVTRPLSSSVRFKRVSVQYSDQDATWMFRLVGMQTQCDATGVTPGCRVLPPWHAVSILRAFLAGLGLWFCVALSGQIRAEETRDRMYPQPKLTRPSRQPTEDKTSRDTTAIATGCLHDEMRYGGWQRIRNGPSECMNYGWVNQSCGAPFSVERLCLALNCRSMLMVGDSLMGRLFLALQDELDPQAGRMRPQFVHLGTGCPRIGTNSVSLRCGSDCTSKISYVRSDHMYRNATAAFGRSDVNCQEWLTRKVLDEYKLVVATMTGVHIGEVMAANGNNAKKAIHDAWTRATYVAKSFVRLGPPSLLYVKDMWGVLNYSKDFSHPLTKPPVAIDDKFSWPLVPEVNRVTSAAFQATLGSACVVIDPTLAMSLRPDCREDYLHPVPGIFGQSTWRMVVNAMLSTAGGAPT